MARNQYKLGTFVQFGNAKTGIVSAVITRKSGYSYHVEGYNYPVVGEDTDSIPMEVAEDSISAAYREVKARGSLKSAKAPAKKKAKIDATTNAQQ